VLDVLLWFGLYSISVVQYQKKKVRIFNPLLSAPITTVETAYLVIWVSGRFFELLESPDYAGPRQIISSLVPAKFMCDTYLTSSALPPIFLNLFLPALFPFTISNLDTCIQHPACSARLTRAHFNSILQIKYANFANQIRSHSIPHFHY
jgi:hypothetical protein